MMIVSLHVSGEIPKITAPDSQKMSEEGGSYKTDRGLPHTCPTHGKFALINAMHQIPIGIDLTSGAAPRREIFS